MQMSVTIVIACPAEVVFAYVSNYENDPQWRAGVLEMTSIPPGSPQIGTKTREVARFFGQKRVTPAEVTQYEAGRTIAFAGLMAKNIPVSGSRTVERIEDLTRFTYQARVELSDYYRLVEPLIALILRKRFTRDLQRLKKQLEKHGLRGGTDTIARKPSR